MSTPLFNRSVQVQISSPSVEGKPRMVAIPKHPEKEPLKIDFSVSLLPVAMSSGESWVTLYNLNDQTQTFIKKQGDAVKLLVGYGNRLTTIFSGAIVGVDTAKAKSETESFTPQGVKLTKEHVSTLTQIILGNQVFALSQAYFAQAYLGLVTVKQVITEAIGTFNLPYENLDSIPESPLINYTFAGRTKDLFDQLLTPLGIQWFVDNATIKFTQKGQAMGCSVVYITPETGLIEFPAKTEKGVKVKTLFNPQIALGKLIGLNLNPATLTSDGRRTNQFIREINGNYKVIEVKHEGSSYDGDMVTILEAVAL